MKNLLIAALAMLVAACNAATDNRGPRIEFLNPPDADPDLPFSAAVRVDDLLFLSGNLGRRPDTRELADGGIQGETRQTMDNVVQVLEAAGATLEDVVKCTVFLADIADYAAMNEVYLEYFPNDPPARSAMAGSGLALGALVEVECIAVAPEGS